MDRSLADIAFLKLPPGILSGGLDTIIKVIAVLLNLAIALAFILCFFYLLFGGIKYIISTGDKKGVEDARSTITHALVGLVLALCSFAIISFIQSWFGIKLGLPYKPFSQKPVNQCGSCPTGMVCRNLPSGFFTCCFPGKPCNE